LFLQTIEALSLLKEAYVKVVCDYEGCVRMRLRYCILLFIRTSS